MGEIGFNQQSDYWLDVAVFEKKVSSVLAKPIQAMEAADTIALERSLELCEGELLEGFYDDWALRERERLRALYLKCLAHLMHYHKDQKAHEKSLNLGQRILNYDPLREEIHREMMRLFLEGGHRAMAIRQYQTCCQILEEELGIQPMEETQLLHEQVLKTTKCDSFQPYPEQTPAISTPGETTSLEHAFKKVDQAMRDFENVRAQLQHAISYLERLAKGRDFPEAQ
jgi:DNA-binding SARP family transcriptional activator